MWCVYLLRCAHNSVYVGETGALDRRLAKDNDGTASVFTAKRRPVALVCSEEYATRPDALKRGRQIKGWTHAKNEAVIAGDAVLLKQL